VRPPPARRRAKAWITAGTGTAKVTRTFKGVVLGDNGPFYFTARAVARADVHQRLHVAASKVEHDRFIAKLEQRVAQHTGEDKALLAGATKDEAIAALQKFIDWNASIKGFSDADTAQNQGGGVVDTTDMADPTFVKNYGPRVVNGKRFDNYIDQAPGPAAAPTRVGGSGTGAAVGSGTGSGS
jgi:hypothetical protein